MPDDQRPLLPKPSASYGATHDDVESGSTTRAASPVKKPEEVKESKEFKEIWASCLGLSTA